MLAGSRLFDVNLRMRESDRTEAAFTIDHWEMRRLGARPFRFSPGVKGGSFMSRLFLFLFSLPLHAAKSPGDLCNLVFQTGGMVNTEHFMNSRHRNDHRTRLAQCYL